MSGEKNIAELSAAGLSVERHNDDKHWVVTGHGLRMHHWPSSSKWMAYARVWQASAAQVIAAVQHGRIRMPDDARKAKCRNCSADIWWVQAETGRWQPLDADGASHIAGCRT
ncbi:MAG: hypothetical protein H0W93_08060 [Gammaproteobacteria bacterium]|nr:hypothetical protein [Gammaproteobacteria bacterium]